MKGGTHMQKHFLNEVQVRKRDLHQLNISAIEARLHCHKLWYRLYRRVRSALIDLFMLTLALEGTLAIDFLDKTHLVTWLMSGAASSLIAGMLYTTLNYLLERYRLVWARVKFMTQVLQVIALLLALSLGFLLLDPPERTIGVLLGMLLLSLALMFNIRLMRRMRSITAARNMNMAKLIARDSVLLHSAEAQRILCGKVILVTGAAGSIGSELCRQLLNYQPALLLALDSNETGLFDLAQSLRHHPNFDRLALRISDITNAHDMQRLFLTQHISLIFHAAAYKHVPLLEQHPCQAVRTNVLATAHLCQLALQNAVEHFIFISSDKATEPKNILGASKRAGEIIIQAMAQCCESEDGNSNGAGTRFCAVRFGNVIGSRGSVVPVFNRQIEEGGPVTVTDPQATRYFMTIPEACGLVILTAALAEQGGIYLLDMGQPVRILDLAVKMIQSYGLREERDIPIAFIGLRPGERLHEMLVSSDEQLVPTSHEKILAVRANAGIATLPSVQHLIQRLEQSLLQGDDEEIRAQLFSLVHLRAVSIVHSNA
jgi:FlaA1/EpsC-like NDP-sugar epimerase